MSHQETDGISLQLESLKSGIKEISHEMSNPLGVIRMAAYFLESTNPEEEKRLHYLKVVSQNLDKIEACLQKLKILRENPTKTTSEPAPPDSY
jgi:nitrogen-specific signal transduction histidine kinase